MRHDASNARYPKPEFVQLQLPPLIGGLQTRRDVGIGKGNLEGSVEGECTVPWATLGLRTTQRPLTESEHALAAVCGGAARICVRRRYAGAGRTRDGYSTQKPPMTLVEPPRRCSAGVGVVGTSQGDSMLVPNHV